VGRTYSWSEEKGMVQNKTEKGKKKDSGSGKEKDSFGKSFFSREKDRDGDRGKPGKQTLLFYPEKRPSPNANFARKMI